MNELIKKYAEQISKISGITTIGDIELQLHHLLAEVDILETIENELVSEFEWDNWRYEPDDKEYIEGSDNYWKVPQVLYCKLEWLEGYLNEFIDEDSEHLETIDQLKRLLKILENDAIK